ncbi:TPA: terminase B, partial [Clostridioides difficile]|nr:terminase B [Clostridioides difficile]HBF0673061.1 terminase B [Clostridioides difficile]HBH0915307.1 terminase B [Clostridioides difficile]HBH2252766.1 terminase B [Clostridioides difficile]HBY2867957.1 terminase B [Clostridioides difficile]
SPRTSKDNIEMLKRKYHEGSDPWRVRVLGEFPKGESDSLISLEAVETSTIREVNISNDYILNIGADIARYGDDETIIAPRIGGKVFDLLTYSKKDTMETVGNILRAVDKFKSMYHQINRVKIKTDDDGLGAGVTDRLKEVIRQERLKYEIVPIQNGSSAIEKDKYYNKASEMWDNMREELDANLSGFIQNKEAIIQLPNDDKLI